MSARRDLVIGVGSAAVFALIVYMLYKKGREAGAFDPTNENNLAAQVAQSIGVSLTGNPNFNFGNWLFEINPLNAGRLEAEAAAMHGTPQPARPWTGDIGSETYPLPPDYSAWGTKDARDYQNEQAGGAAVWGRYPSMKGNVIDAEVFE